LYYNCSGACRFGAVVGRVGLFEVADKGTIFIDEISELPLALQGKLLRVMETRQIRRVGRPGYVDLDIRIVVATNRDLRKMVREGTFRHDLYQRLNILKIDVPPLRERPEDTFSLIAHFMRQFDIETVSKKVLIQLVSYPWPGNIREMKHALESAVITSDIPKIDKVDLDPIVNDDESQKLKRPSNNLKQVVRDHILYVFRKNKGNVRKAAEELGIMRPTMYNKLKEYGIK
jgi:transcriptional regulator with PAS, ATPase and Fis domain